MFAHSIFDYMEAARKSFHDALDDLKESVMSQGLLAEQTLNNAVQSLIRRDRAMARDVIEKDHEIDRMELEIQSTSMVIIAREAPVARDLRFIASAMAVSSEIERVGDDAVSIAKKALTIKSDVPFEYAKDLSEMSDKARSMLRNALKAFSDDDQELLDAVIAADAEVDQIWKRVRHRLKDDIRADVEFLDKGYKLIQAFHHLEYAGDHAVAIAERLEFVRTGNLVRFSRATI